MYITEHYSLIKILKKNQMPNEIIIDLEELLNQSASELYKDREDKPPYKFGICCA